MIKQGEYNVFADIVKVWIHEFARVVSDRFFTTPELEVYENILREVGLYRIPFMICNYVSIGYNR